METATITAGAHPRRLLRALVAVPLLIAVAVEFYLCVFHYNKDFLWHRNFGIALLHDQLYDTFGFHYPPGRAMIDAATAWLPYRLDRAIWLVAGCASLAICVRFWSRVSAGSARPNTLATILALVACSTYILRDLPECGMQMILLALLSAGFAALVASRPALCGMSLGVAAVYKVTPLLFLPYLLWKREWRAAGWMCAATVIVCLMPALMLGWQKNLALHRQWVAFVSHTLESDDLSDNGVEPPELRNQSLPLVLARLVQDFPEDHPLHVDHKLQLARLEPAAAKRCAQVILVLLAVTLAWRFRQRVEATPAGRIALAREWSAVCILVALLSPLCWLQHLLLVLPAAIVFAQQTAAGHVRGWQFGVAALAAALALLVHRDLLGRPLCDLLSTLQPHTAASMLLLTAVLGTPAAGTSASGKHLRLPRSDEEHREPYRVAA